VKKPINMLTHNDSKGYQDNALDRMVDYLIAKGDYNPRLEKSFRPAFVNRLDRNTSGILIGAKNLKSLQDLNKAIKNREIKNSMSLLWLEKSKKILMLTSTLKRLGTMS